MLHGIVEDEDGRVGMIAEGGGRAAYAAAINDHRGDPRQGISEHFGFITDSLGGGFITSQ